MENREALILALLRNLDEQQSEQFVPFDVDQRYDVFRNVGRLRLQIEGLIAEGLIAWADQVPVLDDPMPIEFQIHRLTRAFEPVARDLRGSLRAVAPTSYGYVPISHNQQAEVAGDLATLKEAIRGSNETTEEQRELALYEIAVFEAAIVAPRAATDLIQRFVDTVLGWIKRTFTAATVQEVAQRLIQALLKFIP